MVVILRSIVYMLPPIYLIYFAWDQLPVTAFSVLAIGFTVLFTIDSILSTAIYSFRRVYEEKLKANMAQLTSFVSSQLREQHAAQLETLRISSGREHLADNPISIAAASLDAMKSQSDRRLHAKQNPLRAALDGTLSPEDLLPPDEPPTFS